MIKTEKDYVLDDNPQRVDVDALWTFLSQQAYWARWRSRADLETQLENSWRIVAAYDASTGTMVGFSRAVSDGVAFAYLADVYVVDTARGHGVGKAMVEMMIDEGPGNKFRWMLHTEDAHGLYEQFEFTAPPAGTMERAPQRR